MAENGSYKTAFWVMTFIAVTGFGWTTFCYFNNGDKIMDLSKITNHSLTAISESMSAINVRLSRIEWTLEGK